MIIYRIRSRMTGLFSAGGQEPRWVKTGKIWKGLGPLKLHFNSLTHRGRSIYDSQDAEVVEYEVIETEGKATDADIWIADVLKRKATKAAEVQAYRDSREKLDREVLFKKLSKEFGPTK
jgi:hypothetical protein